MIIKPISTNVITGFLGVGKTTLIKRLLADKPAEEKWAVLVNEFGEIGIDSALLGGGEEGVEIREVAGGCMCCAAGVPMQVAINQLILKAKPDRLLIEPTGLGHPREVLKVLSQPHYQNVIKLKSTLCLVDARKVADPCYRDHDIFNQQLEVADIILATKSDLYSDSSLPELTEYLVEKHLIEKHLGEKHSVEKHSVEKHSGEPVENKGQLLCISLNASEPLPNNILACLNEPTMFRPTQIQKKQSVLTPKSSVFELDFQVDVIEFDARGILSKTNSGEGAFSCGWIFDPSYEFNFDEMIAWVKSLDVLRLKAVIITDEGIAGINFIEGEMTVTELDDVMDSRLELISLNSIPAEGIEAKLLSLSSRLQF
ncbi:GTP-binding protein [Shewanella eurypsychrophilus]|uniref:GTP-binding protein n=1 Tax=Shewanella eurypsychrophilus TaxID=2593656 RepID=A0ABX6VB53_9GAMM|nr:MULTISPECIES: GTP-binding protein [Shewanella]QFU23903.1 GTP-binding protein [Shewanella sp. YLB-09]QPG59121.1 GTP-binding protein [Shewanella eurypsychrophilus]